MPASPALHCTSCVLGCGLTLRPHQIHAVLQVMLLTSRPNMAEAMFSAALWAVSKVIRLAGPAIEASHPGHPEANRVYAWAHATDD